MKKSFYKITRLFKVIALALAFMTLLLQPMANLFFSLNEVQIEVYEIDLEEDSQENEDQKEDDRKEDKSKLQYANTQNEPVFYLSTILTHQVYQPIQDFSREIPIPPPEQV